MAYGQAFSVARPTDGQTQWGEDKVGEVLEALVATLEAKVTAAGIDLQGNLAFSGNNATDLSAVTFRNASNPGSRSLYFVSNELWMTDGSGNALQLTLNGAINVSSVASITGLAGSGASAAYASGKFTWLDNTAEGAQMEFGQLRLRKPGTSTVVTVKASTSMGADYSVTMPSGTIAAGTGLMVMDSTGQVGVTKDPPTLNNINVSSTGSFGGAVTFNGKATANAQLVAAANSELSGTTRFSGSVISDGAQFAKTLFTGSLVTTGMSVLSGTEAFVSRYRTMRPRVDASPVGSFTQALNGVQPSVATPAVAVMALDLDVGERIRYIEFAFSKPASTSISGVLGRVDANVAVDLIHAGAPYAATAGAHTFGGDLTSLNLTGSMGTCYYMKFVFTGSAASLVSSVTAQYDRPIGTSGTTGGV